jgi:hypothetical protein
MDRIWKFSAPAPFFSSLFRPGVISQCICLGNICLGNICLGNICLGNIDLRNRRPEGVL